MSRQRTGELSQYTIQVSGVTADLEFVKSCIADGDLTMFTYRDERQPSQPPEQHIFGPALLLKQQFVAVDEVYDDRIYEEDRSYDVARAFAENVIPALNGVSKLLYRSFEPISVEAVGRFTADRRVKLGTYAWKGVLDWPRDAWKPGSDIRATFRKWTAQARQSDPMWLALYIYSELPRSWTNLWLVYEIVKEAAGGQNALEQNEWADADLLRRFRYTANKSRNINEGMRHASSAPDWDPSRAIPLGDGELLIRKLLMRWLGDATGSLAILSEQS